MNTGARRAVSPGGAASTAGLCSPTAVGRERTACARVHLSRTGGVHASTAGLYHTERTAIKSSSNSRVYTECCWTPPETGLRIWSGLFPGLEPVP